MTDKPPFTITVKAADYLAKIVEAATRLELGTVFKRDIKLHRENRLRMIHSSLAIEGNALSLDNVTAVIDGKLVAGKQADIREVKNAYEAYNEIVTFDPYSVTDFLRAHERMTGGLVKESGRFRSTNMGVFEGERIVHLGANPQFVPQLIEDLFIWAKGSELHPILKSAVIHYEIETIHPFEDGNGRMGRLWQTLLLSKWNAIFAWVPTESVIFQNRPQYYQAIEESREVDDSGTFIEFTLSALLSTVEAQLKHKDEHKDEHKDDPLSDTMILVLDALRRKPLARRELFAAMGMVNDFRAFKRNVEPLLTEGYVEMTVPDKPNSKLQKYRLTERGRTKLSSLKDI